MPMQTEEIKSKGKKKAAYNPPGKFPKSLWFDLSRKEEWEAMAKKEGKTLAAFIQDNVGNFSQVCSFVQHSFDVSKEGTEAKKAYKEILDYMKVLKTK